jgi:serine/threonine-protein kinase RsbW
MGTEQDEHTLKLPSSRKNIHQVEEFLRRVNESYRLSDEQLYMLLVAVTEAVNNGIIHGNGGDESKYVTVTCSRTDGSVVVRVRDEGTGFRPGELSNPLEEENLLRTGGRGVFLMRSFMQSVTYNDTGNEVTMVMKL